jgi:hypothetical protein
VFLPADDRTCFPDTDKRRDDRFDVDFSVSYTVFSRIDGAPIEYGSGTVLDVSASGMAILVEEPPPPRMVMQLILWTYPHFHSLTVGKCVYCVPVKKQAMFRAGIAFTGPPADTFLQIVSELQRARDGV